MHVVAEDGTKLENFIMESHIGRKLKRNEKVVFINGNSLDCRKQNLKIVTLKGVNK